MDDSGMKKLALWHTRTFRPIMTHDELEPIMSTLGFVGQPPRQAPNGVVWRDYIYAAGEFRGRERWLTSSAAAAENGGVPPRPRLPYQRIDGLHVYTYRAFLDAVGFYLEMDDVSDLFHIRGLPLHRIYDRKKKFRRMGAEENVFVYVEGSLDPSAYALYHVDTSNTTTTNVDDNKASGYGSVVIRSKDNTSFGTFAPLKDIIV